MSDSEMKTDLRRPCTPSGAPASAVLAHALTNALAPVLGAGPPSGAPGHRMPRPHSASLILRRRHETRALLLSRPDHGRGGGQLARRSQGRGSRPGRWAEPHSPDEL